MKNENANALERLSLFCHISGLFSVFLGMAVAFFDLTNGDMRHVQVGIYVFITGYALVKISSKISAILLEESSARRP